MNSIVDLFAAEDRVELKVSQLYSLLEDSAENKAIAKMLHNGIKNRVPYADILKVVDGNTDDIIDL